MILDISTNLNDFTILWFCDWLLPNLRDLLWHCRSHWELWPWTLPVLWWPLHKHSVIVPQAEGWPEKINTFHFSGIFWNSSSCFHCNAEWTWDLRQFSVKKANRWFLHYSSAVSDSHSKTCFKDLIGSFFRLKAGAKPQNCWVSRNGKAAKRSSPYRSCMKKHYSSGQKEHHKIYFRHRAEK